MIISKGEQEKIQKKYTDLINSRSKGSIPLFIVIVGSQAYGTNVASSDYDFAGVFIQSKEDIYGLNYIEQIDEKKNKEDFGDKEKDDAVFYEVKRFLQLLQTANPTVLSILFSPEDCIIYKHPMFDVLLDKKNDFVTKKCKNSFAGYAIAQCRKAKGLNKKQNWEKEKVTRKDVLDFVYVIEGEKSIPWKIWNRDYNYEEKFIGVVNVPNARDLYAVYFDEVAKDMFSENESEDMRNLRIKLRKELNQTMGFGYKGLVKTGEGANATESNQLRLSSIPKGETPICNIVYNKDSYTTHCKDFSEYQEWLKNRNEARYVETQEHGQKIDSKNIMHLVRLLRMSREIAENKEFIIRRPDAEYLKSIRRGNVGLQEIIDWAEEEILSIDELFLQSDLPSNVEKEFINKLLISLRKNIYNHF
jgi:predicted nucleotidyltransferase